MGSSDDGLMQRFLIFAPAPKIDNDFKAIMSATPRCSLRILLIVVKRMHQISLSYELSEEAELEFANMFSVNNQFIKKFNYKDTFIR